MTPNLLRARIRTNCADAGVGKSSDSRIFSDKEIDRASINAREKLLSYLRESRTPATITTCRLGQTGPGTTGTPIPPLFWLLECGIRASGGTFDPGGYIPYQPISYGGSMVNQGLDCIFAEGGVFKGSAATAVYWEKPTSDLTLGSGTIPNGPAGDVALTDFPDAFYNCLATMVTIDLSKKEPSRASRAPFWQKIWIKQMQTLR